MDSGANDGPDYLEQLDTRAQFDSLADDGVVHVSKVAEAIAKYGINADKINPLYA